MEAGRYRELEDRQRMLQLLYDKLEAARNAGSAALELQVYELEGQTGLGEYGAPEINGIGETLGMSGPHAVGLFKRLQPKHLAGRFHNTQPNIPMYTVQVDNLSDDGMMMIGELPAREQLINALREVIETAEDPASPGDEQDKLKTIEWANTGISLVRNIAWVADKIKDMGT
jgi:hypothetical protein